MDAISLVNAFNRMLVSNVLIVRKHNRLNAISSGMVRNAVILTGVAIVTLFITGQQMGTIQFRSHLGDVSSISITLMYTVIMIVQFPTLAVAITKRNKLHELCKRIIRMDEEFQKHFFRPIPPNSFWWIKLQLVIATLITLYLLCHCILLSHMYPGKTALTVAGRILLQFNMAMRLIFGQLFGEILLSRFQHFQRVVTLRNLGFFVQCLDEIDELKTLLTSIFGFQILINGANMFMTCSVVSYNVLITVQIKENLLQVLWEKLDVLADLFGNMVIFFLFGYRCGLIEVKEQEFKNAVKSLQYTATEEHSEDYLNFLDLINLKLMAESPKITACGLFTVNLQVFYNVFAAIVTYIMILFQFRDFEKA
ncbi:AAEL017158-PE, partial [Aedes aegypti]